MKKLTIISALVFSIGLTSLCSSCGNSKKNSNDSQETTVKADPTPLGLELDSAYTAKTNFGDLITKPQVKQVILKKYGQQLYDILTAMTYEIKPIQKDGDNYTFYALGMSYSRSHIILKYNSVSDNLTMDVMSRGNQYVNGHFNFNAEGWELGYEKDEYGEEIKSKPYITYTKLSGTKDDIDYGYNADLCCVVFKNPCEVRFFTNHLDGEPVEIKIKNNKVGQEGYYDGRMFQSFNERRGGAVNNNSGVYFFGEVAKGFIREWYSLEDYTILFKSNYDSFAIKNPKNFNNIQNAAYKYFKLNEKDYIHEITQGYGSNF